MPTTEIESLKDTVELMTSEDYEDDFKAEYYQLRYRYFKLKSIVDNWDELAVEPKCPRDVLLDQVVYMQRYLIQLEYRAEIEGIEL